MLKLFNASVLVLRCLCFGVLVLWCFNVLIVLQCFDVIQCFRLGCFSVLVLPSLGVLVCSEPVLNNYSSRIWIGCMSQEVGVVIVIANMFVVNVLVFWCFCYSTSVFWYFHGFVCFGSSVLLCFGTLTYTVLPIRCFRFYALVF